MTDLVHARVPYPRSRSGTVIGREVPPTPDPRVRTAMVVDAAAAQHPIRARSSRKPAITPGATAAPPRFARPDPGDWQRSRCAPLPAEPTARSHPPRGSLRAPTFDRRRSHLGSRTPGARCVPDSVPLPVAGEPRGVLAGAMWARAAGWPLRLRAARTRRPRRPRAAIRPARSPIAAHPRDPGAQRCKDREPRAVDSCCSPTPSPRGAMWVDASRSSTKLPPIRGLHD
jgi:hypothetical protein